MTYKTPRLRENCGNTNFNEDFIVAVHSGNFKNQLQIYPKENSVSLTRFKPMASAYVNAAVHFQLVLLN